MIKRLIQICLVWIVASFSAVSHLHAKQISSGEAALIERLAAIGYKKNIGLYLRIFKEEKLLEVWIKSDKAYKLYKSYDICNFSGKLGPKVVEGDKQAPEGFYHVPAEDVQWNSAKWPRALNLAFPNIFDALKKRTGSYLLIHGGCSSVGCYALKNGPMSELYDLVAVALRKGQKVLPIHIFPFRLTAKNWKKYNEHKWAAFWKQLQPVYDQFNADRSLPSIMVCQTGYQVYSSRGFVDDASEVRQSCLQPLPLASQVVPKLAGLSWVRQLQEKYKKMIKIARKNGGNKGPRIKVRCNLKLASCKRWLALRKRMLKRGVLPKSLLQ